MPMTRALPLVLLLVALGLGLCLTLALGLPFWGMLIGLVALPLMAVFPEFGETGGDVEVGFAWLIVGSQRAFLAFFVYYSVLCYAILLSIAWFVQRRSK